MGEGSDKKTQSVAIALGSLLENAFPIQRLLAALPCKLEAQPYQLLQNSTEVLTRSSTIRFYPFTFPVVEVELDRKLPCISPTSAYQGKHFNSTVHYTDIPTF